MIQPDHLIMHPRVMDAYVKRTALYARMQALSALANDRRIIIHRIFCPNWIQRGSRLQIERNGEYTALTWQGRWFLFTYAPARWLMRLLSSRAAAEYEKLTDALAERDREWRKR